MTSSRTSGPGLLDGRPARSDASALYRLAVRCLVPFVRWWGRLEVTGAELLPSSGSVLLVANHDSAWDPLIIGVASVRRRQVHALARSSLWHWWPLGWLMDRLGAIPVDRGKGSARAIEAAVAHLEAGDCVGLFPEGTVSRGRTLRAHSGAGRLALAVPSARLVCVAITGAVGMSRFPRRPRLRASFFLPDLGARQVDDTAADLAARLVAEVRAISPPATARPLTGGAAGPYRPVPAMGTAGRRPRAAPAGSSLGLGPAKPRWRGWMHLVFFEVSLVVGTLLIVAAEGAVATTAVTIYAVSVSGLFGVSSLYHRGTWKPGLHRTLQRLDHLMIFVLMAGTATPLFLLAAPGPFGLVCLIVVWLMAAVAACVHLLWMHASDWVVGSAFAALGSVGALAVPAVWEHIGVAGAVLYVVGGVLYVLGGLSLNRRSPDPWPRIFGYHEVFHTYVTAAAVCHYIAIALLVL
ncbi:MAG: 1-acyl-sn-glycerol-3-phosphate acyltransferase [Frankiales bacterium]|jgi:channel protein (hemolysin III family)|nr:1-acyl-sn-glycerol-3-phosphate acyltransferase [Frankiales bacterium]